LWKKGVSPLFARRLFKIIAVVAQLARFAEDGESRLARFAEDGESRLARFAEDGESRRAERFSFNCIWKSF